MNSAIVECSECWQSQWHATGRIVTNTRGYARAECVCEHCRAVFWSRRPAALQAAQALTPPVTFRGEPA